MLRSFEEIYKVVTEAGTRKKIALAAAHDADALTSAANARKIGLADFIDVNIVVADFAVGNGIGEKYFHYSLMIFTSELRPSLIIEEAFPVAPASHDG